MGSARLSEREVLFVFAIIETGGKQYKVIEQDIIFVEKLDVNEGDEIVFDSVMALSNDNGFKAGTPVVAGAKVTAKVVDHILGDKVVVFKHKRRKAERRTQGHRQQYTVLTVTGIVA